MLILELVFYAFIAIVCIQVIYYIIFFSQFKDSSSLNTAIESLPISVIICAKNEAGNLKAFLPSVINQNYPNFQIVLINDASYDNTLEVMEEFALKHTNIKIVNVKNNEAFWANKKYALTLGIKAAKYNHLLFTDADCKPVSEHWIAEMSTCFSKKKSIILGYGGYRKVKNSLLNKLIRFETVLTAIQYVSYTNLGIPYMGVGRNLAYTKEKFFEANGFMQHMHIRSGDDDLFVNQVANFNNATICLKHNSFTESLPKKTLSSWLTQKKRHITTASHYKSTHKFLLGLYFISQFLFVTLALLLLIFQFQWKLVLGLIALRLVMQTITYFKATQKLNEQDIIPFVPFLELFLIAVQLSIFISNLISKPKHWK
ncbi:glycosyltransferase [Hanstruepera marina]|uniref:glycosyltransferase n=1 Tax=Hanstruepera marina TaxID=2873265 RepID=UPI001CA67811|nr:glycosyltransferase [Hanstruepera marina]